METLAYYRWRAGVLFSRYIAVLMVLVYMVMPNPMAVHSGSAVVWALFGLAVTIVLGTVVFAKVFPKLDALRDTDFTAAANATIAGVSTDFYDGVDLLRIAMIIVPIVAVIGFIYLMKRD